MEKVKVLFFSADPKSAPPQGHDRRLLLDEEVREIEQKVLTARYRDDLELNTRWATRTDDLLLALNKADPQVVHFSGHGGSSGVKLVGKDPSRVHSVDAGQLARLFEVFRGDIRLVVLNACFSLPQAKAIAEVVGCAIGTSTDISDTAAIIFSSSFYRAIAFGHSVGTAFKQARMALDLEHLKERDYLELVTGPGVNPAELYLIPSGGLNAGEKRTGETQVRAVGAGPASARGSRRARTTAGGLALISTVAVALKLWGGGAGDPPLCVEAGASQALMAPARLSTAGSSGVLSELDRAKVFYEAGRYDTAFPLFRRYAQRGNPEAMGFAGLMFLRGQGTTARPDSGIYWLREAAERGDARGMTELGTAYQNGDGVKRNRGWARHWLHKAADNKRSAEAMRRLGDIHRDEQNYDTALSSFRNAMEEGSLDAWIDAGQMYEQGQGTDRDLKTARCLYRTAAEAGSVRGMLIMGRIHQNGIGVSRSYERAEEWYRKAADEGSPEAMRALGELYLDGLGVPRDTAQAEEWFGKAAEAGQRIASAGPAAPGTD